MEIKSFHLEALEVKADGDAMTISGYGSTFGGNPDSYGDIIAPGAFAESLKQRTPKMLYQHDTGQIAGVWNKAFEDTKGLMLEGQFIKTPIGLQAYEECKAGAIDSMSIGYSTLKYSWDENTDIRTLQEVRLFEVSLVTFPANENAIITNVKAQFPTTEREFEKLLRDAGCSREKAKIIATRGFKAIDTQRDAEADLTPIYDKLISFTNSIKGN